MASTNGLHDRRPHGFLIFLFLFILGTSTSGHAQSWNFVDVTSQAGVAYNHGYSASSARPQQAIAGGVAAGDYDKDGWVDLYLVRGDIGPNVLLRNRGDGTFEEVGAVAGVDLTGTQGCGPFFADLNGDGWLDLFVGGIGNTRLSVFFNRGDGTFEDATSSCGIDTQLETYSAAAGDYDRDGDLDLFLTHWLQDNSMCSRLWENHGDGTFSCVETAAGVGDSSGDLFEFSFTPNFADINGDRWPDILLASDFKRSQVFLNDRDGTFTEVTTSVISDENGMGAAVGDYDNDGDLDWFVSSIWSDNPPNAGEVWGYSGNRLYRNIGNGEFEDATDEAGVRAGHWGWGASFADFNNDGHLDLYHVNGWTLEPGFERDPAPLFISNGNGTFSERAAELGADHLGQGRGIVCFDFDRDGDIDILVVTANQHPRLMRNDGGNSLNYLTIVLRGNDPNTEAVGARIYVTAGGKTQMRELRAGSNFVSQNPVEAHFGLSTATRADTVRIEWPDDVTTVLEDVPVNQLLTVDYPQAPPPPPVFLLKILDVSPNPFAVQIAIRLELPKETAGNLRIYDVAGRLVRALPVTSVNGEPVTITWNGRDAGGKRVASGVYLIRIETSRYSSQSKRIVVLR